MPNADRTRSPKRRIELGAPGRKSAPSSVGGERIRASRILVIALGAAALLGLFFLVRMAFTAHVAKRGTAVTTASDPQAEAPTKRVIVPERIVVEHMEADAGAVHFTEDILSAQGPDCLDCAKRNGCLSTETQGGTCDDAVGMATGCGPGVTERDICLKVIHDVFTSKCAETMQETPCLCGTTDTMGCISGTATPTGPVYRDYACDFGTTDAVAIQQKFVRAEFGAGRANALVQCAGGFDCACFGHK